MTYFRRGYVMDFRKLDVIQFRLSKREKDLLRELAKEKGMNLSDFIRYCLLKEISMRELCKSEYK